MTTIYALAGIAVCLTALLIAAEILVGSFCLLAFWWRER